jgi:hypothetical protein
MIRRLIEIYMSHAVTKIHYRDQKKSAVNLLVDNMYTINKNTEALIDASKEAGLKVNAQKAKYECSGCLVTRIQDKIMT